MVKINVGTLSATMRDEPDVSTQAAVSDIERTTIHASFFALACGTVGMLGVAVGTLISPGEGSSLGWALHAGGWVLVAIAIIAHIEHLSNRLGRASVICGIVAAVALGVADVPFAIDSTWVNNTGWVNWYNGMWAASSIFAAASLALAAMRKEARLTAHLASGNTGSYAVEDYATTVHASFLSLVTGALGFLLAGISSLILIGGGGPAIRLSWILFSLGSLVIAVAVISHIEHLSLSLGRPAIIIGALAMVLNALSTVPGVLDPVGSDTFGTRFSWVLWGAASVAATIAIGLVAIRRRAQG